MTTNNTKTNAPAANTLMGLLAGAVKAQAESFSVTEKEAKAKAKAIIGADLDLEGLQVMMAEAEGLGLAPEVLTDFRGKAKGARESLITASTAGQMARRLQATSTVQGLEAHIAKVKAKEAAKAEAEKKAKAIEAVAKAKAAAEERIARIINDLGDITPDQAHATKCFLRSNPWDYKANPKGRSVLLSVAGQVARKFREENKLAARAAEAAAAHDAPLTHKVIK